MKPTTKQTFQFFWQHAKRYQFMLGGIIACTALSVFITALIPLWYKEFIDLLSGGRSGIETEAVRILIWVLVLNFVQSGLWRTAGFLNNYFQPRVMSDLHNSCFEYLQGHSYNFFNGNFVGSLVRRVGRFARAFEEISDQVFYGLGSSVWRFLFILVILYARNEVLALLVLGWGAVYVLFNFFFARFKLPYDTAAAAHDTKTSGHLADTVTNNLNLKLFGGFNRELRAHMKLTDKMFRLRKKSWDLGGIAEAGQVVLMVFLEFAVFYTGLKFWSRGIFSLGDFVLVQAYVLQLFGQLWDMGRQIRRIYENLAEAEEMTEILTTPHEVQDKSGAVKLQVTKGQIEFRKVAFGYYDEQSVFPNFNLFIKPGERVALVGPSGGGKTTVVKLLFRFMDIQKGEILIDDQNVAEVTQESLRQNVALVPQEPILFHRTLYENIAYARPNASRDDVMRASKLAHCHEFINSFPDGYETYVGERGIKLSGGERQRVAIARAFLMDAPILVFDEATSNLDSESEAMIHDAIKTLMKDRTTVVIAHRLSTIAEMDRIIVLENGKVTEEGKHEELVKAKSGTYQKLWEIQAGAFS